VIKNRLKWDSMMDGNRHKKHIKSDELYRRAKRIIPGGTQLLSKRPEMFAPEKWPAYFSKAKGCHVWDIDDNEYTDMSIMGIGANVLGYADDDVDMAVHEAIKKGVSSSLNCPEEVELAEKLISLHPWSGMVRYTRSGGEAMAVAVRIARAHTKRDIVLFSGYHGWSDWYLAANLGETHALDGQLLPGLQPNGISRGLIGTAIPFFFNDIENLTSVLKGKESRVAAIVVEPARGEEAPLKYLSALRAKSSEIGAVLIFDEITSGFRMCAGGIHLRYGVNPDVAVFAKSIANGYAMAAVIGTEEVMQAAQSTFISSTNWTERVGPVAALATIEKYMQLDVHKHLSIIGDRVKSVWQQMAKKHDLKVEISGLPSLCHLGFQGNTAQIINTYYCIRMLEEGFLGYRQFKASFAHTEEDVVTYSKAVDIIFSEIANLDHENMLSSPIAHTGFSRLTKE
jgi:glutamate-1-semialdehyde 2,1-aminomutase